MRIVLIALLLCSPCLAAERIIEFASEVRINKDATLDVHETIKVKVEQVQIRHGILREFPTRYKDRFGNSVVVDFTLVGVNLDGAPVDVKESTERNGVVLKIGNASSLVSLGEHTYEIWYKTNRQLGFFETFDELYWNVTGTGWRLPIDSAKARVMLPAPVSNKVLQVDGYTGYFGDKDKNYTSSFETSKGGEVIGVHFETTRPLFENQGLTVAVGWPKGLVEEPSLSTRASWFLRDNLGVGILLAGFIFVLWLLIRTRRRLQKTNAPGTIIPMFAPPVGMLPSEMRFLSRFGYDAQVLSSEVVNLAVNGYLTIHNKEGGWRAKYSVKATNKPRDGASEIHKMILESLFAKSDSNDFARADKSMIELVKRLRSRLNQKMGVPNFVRNYFPAALAGFVSGGCTIAALLLQNDRGLAFILAVAALLPLNIIMWTNKPKLTPGGRKLLDQIEGFRLFLTTAETERLKIVGTPPTRTPELYEKLLPYAIALGVEEAWSRQFTPVFETLESQGHPYVPLWFVAPGGAHFQHSALGKSVTSSLSAAISSSSSAPGSSSGSRGGGSSGGGGGGGGGGGW